MTTLFTSPERSTEGWQAIITVRDIPSANLGAPRSATVAARMGARLDMTSTATIRHALRALASETGLQAGPRGVKLLRPLVAQVHEVLRERLESGGSVKDYLRGRAHLADSAVVGLLHIASAATEMRGDSMVAPLAVVAVAVGGYGRRELAPSSDLDLLFLLPERNQPDPLPRRQFASMRSLPGSGISGSCWTTLRARPGTALDLASKRARCPCEPARSTFPVGRFRAVRSAGC